MQLTGCRYEAGNSRYVPQLLLMWSSDCLRPRGVAVLQPRFVAADHHMIAHVGLQVRLKTRD